MAESKGHGGKRTGSGRKKGGSNKDVQAIRDALKKVIEANLPNYVKWLEQIAAEDPAKAISLLNGMNEYVTPKLQRTEHTGEDGAAITLKIKAPDDGKGKRD